MADYKRAIQLDPAFTQAYVNLSILLAQQGALHEALPYCERAEQLGEPRGAEIAARARGLLGAPAAAESGPAQQAFEAFQRADSPDDMRRAVAGYPLMADAAFIFAVEQAIGQQVPPNLRPTFERPLAWPRQVANEQRPGLFGRLFQKGK
jgi:tetratricopeptide (TPR) repeat protein